MSSVAVIGAGVIGLSSAVVLQRRMPWLSVTLITDRLSPNTTGDGSAGLWLPYLLKDTPPDDVLRWAVRTYKLFYDLWRSPAANESGLCLIPSICLTEEDHFETPEWGTHVLGFTELNKENIKSLSHEHKRSYTAGYHFLTFTCEPTRFLPMLLAEFKSRGGVIEERQVSSLEEHANQYDVIVNCTGLGARFLVPDLNVNPIRGQVMRVKAPWINQVFLDDSPHGNYIIPNIDNVILGGTKQNDWSIEINPKDSEMILSGCSKIVPSLKSAKIEMEWVGLRPGRDCIRLERETRHTSSGSKYEVVHNYGHGGSGVTLCWGCAEQAADIVSNILQEKTPKAKL